MSEMRPSRSLVAALVAGLLSAPGPAGAGEEEILSPSAFRLYAEGYTLHFEHDGRPFGAEHFASGNRTVWQYGDGTCDEGSWRARGAQICFNYQSSPSSLCWRMLRDDQGVFARLLGDTPDAGMILRIVRRDREPLLCGGPEA